MRREISPSYDFMNIASFNACVSIIRGRTVPFGFLLYFLLDFARNVLRLYGLCFAMYRESHFTFMPSLNSIYTCKVSIFFLGGCLLRARLFHLFLGSFCPRSVYFFFDCVWLMSNLNTPHDQETHEHYQSYHLSECF